MPASSSVHSFNRAAKWLVALACLLALIYGAVVGWLWWRQERLLFQPQAWPEHEPSTILAPDVHSVWVDVPGARLNALHLRQPHARGLVFYLHGNAGNAATWFSNVDFYRKAGFDLFMLDYRGYGRSTGHIESEAQLLADVRAAWDQVSPQYTGRPCVVFGRSLGTGLAARLASEVQPTLTVLVSPYTSMMALAGEQYPWVPQAVLRYPLRSDQAVPQIRGRIWIAHGQLDELIPPRHAQALAALAAGQATVLIVPGVAHADVQTSEVYLNGLERALNAL